MQSLFFWNIQDAAYVLKISGKSLNIGYKDYYNLFNNLTIFRICIINYILEKLYMLDINMSKFVNGILFVIKQLIKKYINKTVLKK